MHLDAFDWFTSPNEYSIHEACPQMSKRRCRANVDYSDLVFAPYRRCMRFISNAESFSHLPK